MTRIRFVSMILAAVLTAVVPSASAIAGTPVDAGRFDTLLADDLTRQELVGVYRALQIAEFAPPECEDGPRMFTDVPATNPFCAWIEELARRGITGGCTETKYCPGNPVTRAQMAAFLVRVLEANRTASASAQAEDQVVLDAAPATVLETSITVPAGGKTVTAFATIDVFAGDANGGAGCHIAIGGVAGVTQTSRNGDNIRQNLPLTHSLQVEAGTHPVTVECAQAFSGNAAVEERALSVLVTN